MRRVYALDLDGVLSDFVGGMIAHLGERWGVNISRGEITRYSLAGLTGRDDVDRDIVDQCNDPRFYWKLSPLPGAYEAALRLAEMGEVHIITSRHINCDRTTWYWLKHYFPMVIAEPEHVHFVTAKTRIRSLEREKVPNKLRVAKLLRPRFCVDDDADICNTYAGAGIHSYLVRAPYNAATVLDRSRGNFITPVRDLAEVVQRSVERQKLTFASPQ